MTPPKYNNVGFIGLGAMGTPMVGQLAEKLPKDARIHVFDVVETAVDEICSQYPNRVFKGVSAKDVAEKSVCTYMHNGIYMHSNGRRKENHSIAHAHRKSS